MFQNKVTAYLKSLWPVREKKSSPFTTQKLVMNALLIALHVILARVASIRIGNSLSISVSGITEVVAGLLFGPVSGGLVGLLGSLLNQLFSYGLTVTTPLWIIPAAMKGLMCGWYAKAYDYELSPLQILWILVVSAMVVTTLNTVVLVVDAEIFGYSTKATVLGIMGVKYINGAITSAAYKLITTPLLHRLKRLPGVKKLRE